MKIRHKTTGQEFEVMDGTLYPTVAYEEVRDEEEHERATSPDAEVAKDSQKTKQPPMADSQGAGGNGTKAAKPSAKKKK